MASASAHNIVILGVQGAGKTLYLYRLVASFLEWRGIGRETLRVAQPDEFVAAARAEGVNFDADTEAFLKRVHLDIATHGAPQPNAANAATGHPTITLEFPSLGLQITADDIPGELLTRAAHMVANERSADDPDGTVQNFLRQLQSRFRTCDGVLFFHPPHQAEIEAESEMALRRFAQIALRTSSDKFLPFVIVFTKDDIWAEGKEAGGEGHTRLMTQMAGMAEAVMGRREHFTSTYWRALQDYHRSDLGHAYWSPVASIFGTGRNFISISSLRGSFAELRSPLDMVYRLNREIRSFFRSTLARNVQVAFAAVVLLAAITIITVVILPYAGGVENQVPNFQSPREVIVWLHETGKQEGDDSRFLHGLAGLENAIVVAQDQLDGATSQFTWKSFVVYRDYIARLDNFENEARERDIPELADEVQRIREEVITKAVGTWLERAADGRPLEDLPDAWFESAERYVDELGPYLQPRPDGTGVQAWVDWREEWRKARVARLQGALARVDRNDTYFSTCAQLLESFWRDFVKHHTATATLRFLRLEQEDPRAKMVEEARDFAVLAETGELELTVIVDHLYCPNDPPAHHASALPRGLTARVFKGDRQPVSMEVVLETSDGPTERRRYTPREPAEDGQVKGAITFEWKPGERLQLKLVGRDNSSRAWITVDLEQDATGAGYVAPLPGLWPWYYDRDSQHESRYGSLQFRFQVPAIPELLGGERES